MSDSVMVKDFPAGAKGKSSQRAAVCHDAWRKKLQNNALLTDNSCWTANATEVRTETHGGRPHVVAPCILLVEGVHPGSQGPLLYLEDELGAYPSAWDGRPVVIDHPRDADGLPIPAGSPEIMETHGAGFLTGTHVIPSNGQPAKLKTELWLDVERMNVLAPRVLELVHGGLEVEISTGLFADATGTPGEWNGEAYHARAQNLRPDHLAILPTSTGACSWEDGCGIRANQKGDDDMPSVVEVLEKTTTEQALGVVVEEPERRGRLRGVLNSLATALGFTVENRTGFKAVVQSLQNAVNAFDRPAIGNDTDSMHFVREVFDDGSFIFEKIQNGEASLFKLSYEVDNKGQVTLGNDPEEVIEQRDYVKANDNITVNAPHNTKEREMTVCELIAHEATAWSEDDREFLTGLTEDQLAKLAPVEVRVEVPVQNAAPEPEPTPDPDPEPVLNDADRAILDYGKRRLQEDTEKLVASILSNEGVPYKAETLRLMDIEALEQIQATIAAVKPAPQTPTYVGNAPPFSVPETVEVLPVPTINDLFPAKH
jgi:hypothetical protein